jgi:hypothetical protein
LLINSNPKTPDQGNFFYITLTIKSFFFGNTIFTISSMVSPSNSIQTPPPLPLATTTMRATPDQQKKKKAATTADPPGITLGAAPRAAEETRH